MYNYGDRSVEVNNDTFSDIENYKTKVQLYDINSKLISLMEMTVDVKAEDKSSILYIPDLEELTETYFLDIRLYDSNENEVDRNFYWLSTKDDVLDYDAKFESWAYYTPSKEYADLTLLNSLPQVDIESKVTGDENSIQVTLKNTGDTIAFGIELQLIDKTSGELILPVLWEDNYVSIPPNDNRVIAAKSMKKISLDGVQLRIKGWNLGESKINSL